MSLATLLLLHAGATLFMTGLIWFVQVIHYPLFGHVGDVDFRAYSNAHQSRTSWVVAPIMLLEVSTAVAAAVQLPAGPDRVAAWIGLGLLALIWLSTALVQVPLHRQLLSGLDRTTIRRLVQGNWLRTLAWSLRSGIALWLLRTVGP